MGRLGAVTFQLFGKSTVLYCVSNYPNQTPPIDYQPERPKRHIQQPKRRNWFTIKTKPLQHIGRRMVLNWKYVVLLPDRVCSPEDQTASPVNGYIVAEMDFVISYFAVLARLKDL